MKALLLSDAGLVLFAEAWRPFVRCYIKASLIRTLLLLLFFFPFLSFFCGAYDGMEATTGRARESLMKAMEKLNF